MSYQLFAFDVFAFNDNGERKVSSKLTEAYVGTDDKVKGWKHKIWMA